MYFSSFFTKYFNCCLFSPNIFQSNKYLLYKSHKNTQKVRNVKKIKNVKKLEHCGPDTHLSIHHADLVVQESEVVVHQGRDGNADDDDDDDHKDNDMSYSN
jgi:3-hydroxymyristoyl/3-hydroxydecanoyl-(acyl carrier protein) dehydratase